MNPSCCAEVSPENASQLGWLWVPGTQLQLFGIAENPSAFSLHFPGRAAAGGKEAEHVPAEHVPLQSSADPQP